jgi:hypothetical protein
VDLLRREQLPVALPVAERELRLVSVWHPSFLTLLLEALPRHRDRLVEDLARGRVSPPGPVEADVLRAVAVGLRPVVVCPVQDGQERFLEHHHRRGQHLGDIKPAVLATEVGWGERLGVL